MTAGLIITAIIAGVALGLVGVLLKKLKAERETIAQMVDANVELGQLQDRVDGMEEAVQTAAADIAVALPTLADGEWGLVTLVRKLINELDDARQTIASVRESLAADETEDVAHRAQVVSCRAAVAGAVADILQVPIGVGPAALMDLVRKLCATNAMQGQVNTAIQDLRKWLGARDKESLRAVVQRVITTAEVAPGAATELQKCRAIMDIPPGQSVLDALKEPMEFNARVLKRKGEVVGINVWADRNWPKVGDVEVVTKVID